MGLSYPARIPMFENWKGPKLLTRDDPSIESYAQDTMMRGVPDAVLKARDIADVQEAIRYCAGHKIPITFCGSQTSMTGASVAEGGLLVSTERMEQVLDIGKDAQGGYAVVQPGITVANLKKRVAQEGWFYPPAPTSQDQARIGGTVSTNAMGEDSYQYGSTRLYVNQIKVLLADGRQETLSRHAGDQYPDELNRAGYFPHSSNPLDHFIGGEGTLGFIYEVTVRLVKPPPGFFAALAPFESPMKAIQFIVQTASEKKLKARALEFIDHEALEFMKTHPDFPEALKKAKALVYFKQEYRSEAEQGELMMQWLEALEVYSSELLLQDTVVATSDKQKEDIRLWRHHIPSQVNEQYRTYQAQGGGKVGSDWWVPLKNLEPMMTFVYETGAQLGVPVLAFAHLGRGHPHVNYLCKTAEEKKRAEEVLLASCKKAVAFGGGVAGEHGIGKLHRNLVPLQWNEAKRSWLKELKTRWDPQWIFGRGNILEPPS